MGSTPVVFDPQTFRTTYTEFECGKEFPTASLKLWFSMASAYVPTNPVCCVTDAQLALAANLMTAHLAKLMSNAASGQITGVITEASIDKVSVGLQPPPEKSQYQWWLNQTPYGQALLALFQKETVGGFYAGGSLDLMAFRRPARIWGGC